MRLFKADYRIPESVPFDYRPQTRVVFGTNSVDRVGDLAAELGAKRVLLVTDRGIVKAGHAVRLHNLLENAGITVTQFDQVEENPSTSCVEKCVAVARQSAI